MTGLGDLVMGPLHASALGRCLRRMIGAADWGLRRLCGIFEFEAEPEGLLRIACGRAGRNAALADGTRIAAGDRVIELHVWNEHVPRFPARIGDFRWPARVQQQMRASLCRLARYIRANAKTEDVRALCMRVPLPERGPANAVARLLLMAGFEAVATTPRRNRLLRLFDSLWVWLLTWAYNPRALMGWRFSRTRREFWMSRARFLRLYGEDCSETEASGGLRRPSV